MFEDHASLNEIPFEDDPDLPPPPYIESENNKFVCILCNIPTLNCCSECQQVFYCSAYHQKLHWYKIYLLPIVGILLVYRLRRI